MKCKVLKTFTDKDTLKGYSEGDVYESKDSKRITFLTGEGFLEVLSKTPEQTDPLKDPKSPVDPPDETEKEEKPQKDMKKNAK